VIGLLANQARVLTIVLNPYSDIAAVHTAQGLAMIVLAVLMLAAWDALLGRLLPAPGPRHKVRMPARRPLSPLQIAGLGAAALVLLLGSLEIRPWTQPRPPGRPLSTLPTQMNGEVAEGQRLDKQFMGSTAFSEWVYRRFGKGERAVEVFAGADDRSTGGLRILSPKTAVLESGWSVEDRGVERLDSGREVESFELHSEGKRVLAWRWTEGVASPAEELVRALLFVERSPLRRPGRAVVVRVSTPLGYGPGARDEAEARLARTADRIETSLEEILPAASPPAGAPAARS
jgi:hypothetical protein